ncbi:hypothetical protein RhiirA1_395775 [Rhizophagus irregularis]|uniref:Nacht nucleoside triphosphatase n=1 Tax=Rhizophagus irregularis TaxID=588596 RepID=A0A2I1E079_9GLOM|nr:hypothetical protein RhiirA1_395775 [Rhizophagus irregularis]PKY15525.1 hypothetical protein RhiirB3_514084 [Rhizophagus irregularis]CAB4488190.1 unnamed protein product [Rhizophagus irregularis]CAB5377247.1 unnamed protein product [Rhizophagus irregularis]
MPPTSFSAFQLPKTQIQRKHELVAGLFKEILERFRDWDLCRESPSLFLVYAYDNPSVGRADAGVSRNLIQWLSSLRFHIYSDCTVSGYNTLAFQTTLMNTAKADDVLSSQLCLLPNHSESVDKVILCGSEVLGRYIETSYYQSYYQSLKSAYQKALKQFDGIDSIKEALREVVNHNLKEKEFHHVLTELAFLHIRYDYKQEDHGIIPVLLNGTFQKCFPAFIVKSTTICIYEPSLYVPGNWNGEETYQDQGVHIGFFKLLKRLLVNQERRIQLIEEEVYHSCIQALRKNHSKVLEPQAFSTYMKDAYLKVLDKLLEDGTTFLRQLGPETSPKPIPQCKQNSMLQTAQILEVMQAQTQIESLIEAKVSALKIDLKSYLQSEIHLVKSSIDSKLEAMQEAQTSLNSKLELILASLNKPSR